LETSLGVTRFWYPYAGQLDGRNRNVRSVAKQGDAPDERIDYLHQRLAALLLADSVHEDDSQIELLPARLRSRGLLHSVSHVVGLMN
jgi:hypothetical protein